MKMKLVFSLLSMAAIALIVGCSGVTKIGKVGDTEFYNVHSSNLFAPSVSAYVVRHPDGKVETRDVFSDKATLNQIGPAAVTAAGDVAAAHTFGSHLEPDQVNYSGGNATGGSSSATGGHGGTGGQGGQGGVAWGGNSTATGGAGGSASVDQSHRDNSVRTDNSVRNDNRQVNQNVNVGR